MVGHFVLIPVPIISPHCPQTALTAPSHFLCSFSTLFHNTVPIVCHKPPLLMVPPDPRLAANSTYHIIGCSPHTYTCHRHATTIPHTILYHTHYTVPYTILYQKPYHTTHHTIPLTISYHTYCTTHHTIPHSLPYHTIQLATSCCIHSTVP